MATFRVTCPCGERFHVDEAHASRVITCWRCNRKLSITRPAPAPRAEGPVADVKAPKATRGQRAPILTRLRPMLRAAPRRLRRLVLASLPFFHRWQGWGPAALSMASWGFLATMVVIALVMWRLGDRAALGTVLLFVGRWVYLIPLGLLAWLARPRQRALFLPLGLATIVVFFPVMGLVTGWRRLLPTPSGTPIRVVTFNTAAADSVTLHLPELLARWDADVVAFQECSEGLAASIDSLAGWQAHVQRPLCLLSRFPIRSAQAMDRSALERVRTDRVDNSIGGAGFVVRYVLDTPAGPVGVTNVHLETARKGLETLLGEFDLQRLRENTELRDIESGLARAWVDGGMVPMIVAGDFNASREGRVFHDHWGDLDNAFSRVGIGFGVTRLNGWIRMRIDHVLTGVGLRAVRAWVDEDAWSDHLPLIVDLRRLERVMVD